jgi:hypothetical protein
LRSATLPASFLDDDVAAGFERLDGDVGVIAARRAHRDRIDLGGGERIGQRVEAKRRIDTVLGRQLLPLGRHWVDERDDVESIDRIGYPGMEVSDDAATGNGQTHCFLQEVVRR